MSDIDIRQVRYGAPTARLLVAAAQADLAERYGSGDETPIEAIEFDPPVGAFFIARRDGEPIGCGGWRTLGDGTEPHGTEPDGTEPDGLGAEGDEARPEGVAELKRMYVVPAARGTGVAAALLATIEDSARGSGMKRLVLETGTGQPEAMRFYARSGYEPIENYGHYKCSPEARSYGRNL